MSVVCFRSIVLEHMHTLGILTKYICSIIFNVHPRSQPKEHTMYRMFVRVAMMVAMVLMVATPVAAQTVSCEGRPTYYVKADTGNDANDGLSPATPFKTVAKAEGILGATSTGGCLITLGPTGGVLLTRFVGPNVPTTGVEIPEVLQYGLLLLAAILLLTIGRWFQRRSMASAVSG